MRLECDHDGMPDRSSGTVLHRHCQRVEWEIRVIRQGDPGGMHHPTVRRRGGGRLSRPSGHPDIVHAWHRDQQANKGQPGGTFARYGGTSRPLCLSTNGDAGTSRAATQPALATSAAFWKCLSRCLIQDQEPCAKGDGVPFREQRCSHVRWALWCLSDEQRRMPRATYSGSAIGDGRDAWPVANRGFILRAFCTTTALAHAQ
jgi:hypothetical protein